MTTRSVAVQGLGQGPLSVASQGFLDGAAAASGAALAAASSFTPGLASGAAQASGANLAGAATFAPGAASGAAQATGASLAAAATFAPGVASDTGVATGVALGVAATFTPGSATGSSRPVVLEVGGFSVPISRKKVARVKGRANGVELAASVHASWGGAAGGAKALGHSMRSHSRPTFAMAAGRASAASAEMRGPLFYWQAAHWTPEQRLRAQAADEQLLETLLLEV